MAFFFGDSQLPRCLEPEEANVLAGQTRAVQHKTETVFEYKTETKAPPEEIPAVSEALPDGWCCARAPCGTMYYWHCEVRETTWHRPCPPAVVAFVPAPLPFQLPSHKEERRCQVCCAAKAREEFGREQFKKAWYGLGTCLACAENQRTEAYLASMQLGARS